MSPGVGRVESVENQVTQPRAAATTSAMATSICNSWELARQEGGRGAKCLREFQNRGKIIRGKLGHCADPISSTPIYPPSLLSHSAMWE